MFTPMFIKDIGSFIWKKYFQYTVRPWKFHEKDRPIGYLQE